MLKDKCKSLGLAVTGSKTELFNRLMERDHDGGWMIDDEKRGDGRQKTREQFGVLNSEAMLVRGDQWELEIARKLKG